MKTYNATHYVCLLKWHGSKRRSSRCTGPIWQDSTCQRYVLEIHCASITKLTVPGTINFQTQLGELRTQLAFGIVDELAVQILFGTNFIDSVKRPVRAAKRKAVPHYSTPVPILMVHEARSADGRKEDTDIRLPSVKDLSLLVASTKSEPRPIKATRKVVLKAMCETSILFSIQTAGLIAIVPHNNVDKNLCVHVS